MGKGFESILWERLNVENTGFRGSGQLQSRSCHGEENSSSVTWPWKAQREQEVDAAKRPLLACQQKNIPTRKSLGRRLVPCPWTASGPSEVDDHWAMVLKQGFLWVKDGC